MMNSERRIYPRLHVNIPAEVETLSGVSADVNLINISMSGMMIEGDTQLLELKAPVEGTPLELSLHFGLGSEALHCRCRVVYIQRQSQSCVRYGLCLLSIDQQSADCMQAYIDANL